MTEASTTTAVSSRFGYRINPVGLFGLAVFMFPFAGALAIVWLIAAYAIVYGVLQIVLAVQARKWGQAFDVSFGRLRTV